MPINFREIIQNKMKQMDLSVYRLAKETGVHRDTIYLYLKGKTHISVDKLEIILNYLGVEMVEKRNANSSTQADFL